MPPSPPPPPLAADESPPSDPHRAVPTPFLTKTYHMVDDPAVNDIISWNENGSTFIVWRPADFAHDLLPKYFKHNNFSSFVRQLNTYGFRKIVPDRWEFANDCFRKGEKRLLCDIHRRKIAAAAAPAAVNRVGSPANSVEEQVISSNSSPVRLPPAELAEENDRLRKENRKLANELSKMKNLCNNIFVLMSKFAGSSPESPPEPPAVPAEAAAPAWCCESSPMLFGVSIGEKRCREMEECEELPLVTASTVKTEPLEVPLPAVAVAPAEAAAERRPWVVYCPRPQRVCNGKHRVFMEDDGAHVS